METKVVTNRDTEALLALRDKIVEAILEKKGENVISLDLREIQEAVTDFFIICEATTSTQVRAIAESVVEMTKKDLGERVWHKEGYENLEWVLLDYVNIVVHVFRTDRREFYRLEDLWADAALEEFE